MTDSIEDYNLPSETRKNLPFIESLKTYDDFVSYFSSRGISLETKLDKLKGDRSSDEIPAVKELCQKIATAIDSYEQVFGSNSLNALRKITLYDSDLDTRAGYFFNLVGEHDPRAGEIAFRNWNISGRDVYHELAHAFQDSVKRKGEDCVSFSNRIAKSIEIPESTYRGSSGIGEENAEMMAEALAFGFTQGIEADIDLIKKLRRILL